MDVTGGKEMREYRFDSKVGDVVRMKNGVLAIVVRADIIWGGHVKELTLFPLTGLFYRIFLFFTGQLRLAETDINNLTKIGAITV